MILERAGPFANSDVDLIKSDPIKGLRTAEGVACVLDEELTSEEVAAGMKHYCLPHPVAKSRRKLKT